MLRKTMTPLQLIQNIKRRSIVRNTMILLAAITLSTAVATDTLAAGRGDGGGPRGGHVGDGFRRPFLNSVPSVPPPVFNRSSPYTVPTSPETHVSPASPGSGFSNDFHNPLRRGVTTGFFLVTLEPARLIRKLSGEVKN